MEVIKGKKGKFDRKPRGRYKELADRKITVTHVFNKRTGKNTKLEATHPVYLNILFNSCKTCFKSFLGVNCSETDFIEKFMVSEAASAEISFVRSIILEEVGKLPDEESSKISASEIVKILKRQKFYTSLSTKIKRKIVGIPNKLRVVHYPQIPCKPFIVEVENEREAYLVSETLANQHLWLLEENIIPDFNNIIHVEMLGGNVECAEEWQEYYNDEEKMDWDELKETFFES